MSTDPFHEFSREVEAPQGAGFRISIIRENGEEVFTLNMHDRVQLLRLGLYRNGDGKIELMADWVEEPKEQQLQ